MSLNISSPEEVHSMPPLRELSEIVTDIATAQVIVTTTTASTGIAISATTFTSKGNDVKPVSRPPSVLPNILASLASSSSSPSSSITSSANISSGKQQQQQHQELQQQRHDQDVEHVCSPSHQHHHQQHQSMTMSHSNTPRSSSSPIFEIPTHSASPLPPHSGHSSSSSTSAGAPQQFCLRWNNYQSNLTSVFDQLLQSESFVDVTLACDGRSIKAHKMVLSACSPYFQSLFFDTPCRHPIVIMKDVGWHELKTIVEFMYKGEINVNQDQIGPILRIAEMLKVRGLADVGNIETTTNTMNRNDVIDATISPPIKRQRSHTPPGKRSQSHHRSIDFDGDPIDTAKDFLFFAEPEKKAHLHKTSLWNVDTNINSRDLAGIGGNHSTNQEIRLSPLPLPLPLPPLPPSPLPSPHTSLLQRSARKRRWTSADALFNPTVSPLSGLIAAERAEQEHERARQRDRECEHLMLTSMIPVSTVGSSHHLSGCKSHIITSVPATNSLQKGNSAGTTSNLEQNQSLTHLLPPSHTPTNVTSSPHLQTSQSLQSNTSHHSQETSPAQSIASTRPSNVFSEGGGGGGGGGTGNSGSGPESGGCGTGSGIGGGISVGGRDCHLTQSPTGTSSNVGELRRFPANSAAAMAAAAGVAHIDLTPSPHRPLDVRSHSSPGLPLAAVSIRHHSSSLADDLEIKPGIAEMIREEERAKMLESTHAWMSSGPSIAADSYQYQLQSMWQKCWNTNQSLMHHLRFRERGPLKSWRPETMAEAIFSVLKEGLSLSQAARKYDIPYPTFVLYANRVHNMLGPSIDGGPDLRPKGRGRPQRILLGIWPDEHIKGVIKTVVFRDAKDLKEEAFAHLPYGRHSPVFPFQDLNYVGPGGQCSNGIPPPTGDQMSQEATAAAVAAVAHNFRQQMQMAAAQHQQHADSLGPAGLFNMPPHLTGLVPGARGPSPLACPSGPSGLILPKASISPALSTTSNPSGGVSIVGPRHAPSPCASVPGIHQLPPSMAAALQMVGTPGRCETATMMSQQQQQQLQQLHIQQQAALHHHQKHSHSHSHQPHQHQHQHQQMLFGTSSIGHPSSIASTRAPATTSLAGSPQQMLTTKSSISTMSSSPERQRHRMPSDDVTLRSTLTDFGFDLDHSKTSRPFTPARLFPDDIAELVGVAPSRNHRTLQEAATSSLTTIPRATTPSDIMTSSVSSIIATLTTTITTTTTTSTTSNKSSSNVKLEPIATTSE